MIFLGGERHRSIFSGSWFNDDHSRKQMTESSRDFTLPEVRRGMRIRELSEVLTP